MPKPLPPAIPAALNPPPSAAHPYRFFEGVGQHLFESGSATFVPRNAWWLMEAAFLSYSNLDDIRTAYGAGDLGATVTPFPGPTTWCYVASTPDWIVLAFRGTQVDDFWSSVLDWATDARFFPVLDSHGHFVHAGFLSAVREVWAPVSAHLLSLQRQRPRPLWITGHSLGAAVATLAANLCADVSELGLAGVCTYGSPRVGDRNFGRRITAPVWRFQHSTDIVTQLPLGLVFRHVGELRFIDGTGHVRRDQPRQTILAAGAMSSVAAEMRGNPLATVPPFLADHAPINYATRLWNAYESDMFA